jgi:predicted chitinase
MTQTFAFTASSVNGYHDVANMTAVINGSLNGVNACYFQYYQGSNSVSLANDGASSATVGTIGTAITLSNSQCQINLGASSVAGSGNSLTLSLNITFNAAFLGAKNMYMTATNAAGLSSSWLSMGTWTIPGANQPPTNVSVSPSSGSGMTQTFAFTASSVNGYHDVANMTAVINGSLNGVNACYFQYYQGSNSVSLANDGASSATAGTIGTATTLSNSQCQINLGASSVAGSGNSLTVSLNITFKAAFLGVKNIYMTATNAAGLSSSWLSMGTWTIPGANQPPANVSVSPSSGSGTTQTFAFTESSANGYHDVANMTVVINGSLNGVNACYFQFYQGNNALSLANDGASAATAGTIGTATTLSNSQCQINLGASSVAGSGNNLTVSVNITFKSAFMGTQTVYMFGTNAGGLSSSWQSMATWTVPGANQPPTNVSVSPSSGSGTTQTFAFTESSVNGYHDVANMTGVINGSLNGVNACYFQYYQGNNVLSLANDSASSATAGTIGTATTLSNSQCQINLAASSVAGSGNNLTVSLNITFKTGLVGAQNIYMTASNTGGLSSAWQQMGTWTH